MAKPDRTSEGSRIKELEAELRFEKLERGDAEQRATRANERAREADEAYRKLQLDLVNAKDEALAEREKRVALEEKVKILDVGVTKLREEVEAAKAAAANAKKSALPPPSTEPKDGASFPGLNPAVAAQVEQMLARIEGLRELLASASIELSQLHADEVALGKKRTRVLADACALLARAVGVTGQAPPPIPSPALEARLTVAPVVDISEVADLIESLRPPKTPKVE